MLTLNDLQNESKNGNAVYLGDGAYAHFDGYAMTVYTSDGVNVINQIYLDPEVSNNLVAFMKLKRVVSDAVSEN